MKKQLFVLMLFSLFLSLNAVAAKKTIHLPKTLPIKGGTIVMSTCPEGINVCPAHDYAVREVTVKSFEMGQIEITLSMYDECIKYGGCQSEVSSWSYKNRKVQPPCIEGEPCQHPFDENWGRGLRPAINVSWLDVQMYIKWINKESGNNYRLPTSQEWEYAARGGLDTTYPWGNEMQSGRTNCANCGSPWSGSGTLEVARFAKNQFGLYDMLGNVSEWTSSCFPIRKKDSQECMKYIYRGGAWHWASNELDPSGAINAIRDTKRTRFVGFRLARDKQ